MKKITLFFVLMLFTLATISQNQDECVTATSLTVNPEGTGCASPEMIDNTGTTNSAPTNGIPSLCGNVGWADGADIWYTIVAPTSGAIIINTPTPSTWSSMMYALYNDCADTTEAFCGGNFDIVNNGGTTSTVTSLTPGQTYYIRFWDFFQNEEGQVAICIEEITPLPPPENDDLCNAISLTVDAVSTGDAYTSIGATAETDEVVGACFNGGINGSTWYTFVAPVGGNVTVTTDIAGGTHTDTEVAVYEAPTDCTDASTMGAEVGCDQDGGEIINFNSKVVLTGLTEGSTYYIQIDRWGTATDGTFGVEVRNDNTVSVGDLETVGFNYYPNPVSNELHLTARENITNISIFNMLGQELKNVMPSTLNTTIDMSSLTSGAYFVKAQVGNVIGTFKVIKK